MESWNLAKMLVWLLGIDDPQSIEILGQAILGSSLYILFRAQKFMANRSFDPRYNSLYFTRWVTGIISGVVLAYLPLKSGAQDFSPGLLALLGGFTAEAVELILKRFVEILVTAVNGDRGEAATAEAAVAHQKKSAEVLAKVAEIKVDPNSPAAQTIEQVKALLKQETPSK